MTFTEAQILIDKAIEQWTKDRPEETTSDKFLKQHYIALKLRSNLGYALSHWSKEEMIDMITKEGIDKAEQFAALPINQPGFEPMANDIMSELRKEAGNV